MSRTVLLDSLRPVLTPRYPFLIALLAALAACAVDSPDEDLAADIDELISNPTALVLNDQTTVFDLAGGVERDFSIGPIPGDGRTLVVAQQPTSGDSDLYVGWTTSLSRSSYTCASVLGGTQSDWCVISVPNDNIQRTLYVKSYGYTSGRSWLRVHSAPANGSVEVNGASRIYQIPGDNQWYYLDFVVPGSVKRATIYATPVSGNNLSMWLNGCYSDQPGPGVERCELAGTGITQTARAYFRSNTGSSFNVQVTGTDRLFGFPLRNQTPSTTAINSIVDHQLARWYNKDDQMVTDAWGEVGEARYGSWADCYSQASGTNFSANGNYTGAGHPNTLCYNGHPGLDLKAGTGTDILAICDGIVRWPSSDPVNSNPTTYNTIYIDCGGGWSVWILHSSWTAGDGTPVRTGDPVAGVGATGVPPGGGAHLHLEIRRYGIPVDPYGWQAATRDPMWIVPAVRLWQ